MLIQKTVDNGIWLLTIARENALNALNSDVLTELSKLIDEALLDPSCRGIILTGSGSKAFVAGADITAFQGLDAQSGERLAQFGQDLFNKIEHLGKPVIAAINGFALGGGCELAMSCHLRIAGSHAKFGQPEVNLGLIPGYGGTQRLVRYIGRTKAMELLLTADMIPAGDALQLGLVNQVVEPGQEVEAAKIMLNKILAKAPLATAKIIDCVNTFEKEGVDGYKHEAKEFGKLIASEDAKEGIEAFLQKRKAQFQGK